MAFDYIELGENQKALENFSEALKISREVGEKSGQLSSLMGIASVHRNLGEQEKSPDHLRQALDNYELGLQLSRELEDNSSRAAILSGIGRVYIAMDEPDKALRNLNESLQLAKKYEAKVLEPVIHLAFGKLYENIRVPEKAVNEYQEALLSARIRSDKDSEAKAFKGLMSTWKARDSQPLAIFYGKQAVNRYQELRSAIRTLR